MITENDFIGLIESQRQFLKKHYEGRSKSIISNHKSEWKKFYSNDPFMLFLNQNYSTDHFQQMNHLEELEINGEDYYVLQRYRYIALFNVNTNAMHTYQAIIWKSTNLYYWANTNAGYGYCDSGEKMFAFWKPEDLHIFYEVLDEFDYIDFSKLKYANPYILLNERNNKQKLWTIEMLIKSGYIQFASDLASSYRTIDFKIFKQYLDFFKKPGKSIYHYEQIIELRNRGFDDPEYMFTTSYLGYKWIPFGHYNSLIDFLNEHPEIKRNRLLKYIKGRKGSKTQFGINFLRLYLDYLKEAADLKLDLSKDKYAFPENLIKAMEDHLLSIYPYKYANGKFVDLFENWQSKLPFEQQSDFYISMRKTIKRLEKQKVKSAEKRVKEKLKFLKFIWDFNSKFRYEIDDTYVLVAPTSTEDLLIEGKTLNHCVFGYVDRIARRDTCIYFLRKKGHEEKPYYTVEIKNGVITQCRTTNNQINSQVKNILENWYQENKQLVPSWDLEKEVNYAH